MKGVIRVDTILMILRLLYWTLRHRQAATIQIKGLFKSLVRQNESYLIQSFICVNQKKINLDI